MEEVNNSSAILLAGPENRVRKSSHIVDMDDLRLLSGENSLHRQVNLRIPQIYKMPDGFEKERFVLCSISPVDVPRVKAIDHDLIHYFFGGGAK